MIELKHADLFRPPPETRVVVVPCSGETWPGKKAGQVYTPLKEGYGLELRTRMRFSAAPSNLGGRQNFVGVTPIWLTAERTTQKGTKTIYMPGNHNSPLPLRYHIVSLPTRKFAVEPINVEFLCTQLRALVTLCDGKPELAAGLVVLPQIADPAHGKLWADFRPYGQLWLPERFVVITGKEGTAT